MPDSQRARALRKKSTWAEKLMWRWLRDRKFGSYRFRRQHPLGGYNLDFFCEEARLAVELDGSGHGFPLRQAHDVERDKYLTTLGIKTLRFWNHQLKREQQFVRDIIFRTLEERAPRLEPGADE